MPRVAIRTINGNYLTAVNGGGMVMPQTNCPFIPMPRDTRLGKVQNHLPAQRLLHDSNVHWGAINIASLWDENPSRYALLACGSSTPTERKTSAAHPTRPRPQRRG